MSNVHDLSAKRSATERETRIAFIESAIRKMRASGMSEAEIDGALAQYDDLSDK